MQLVAVMVPAQSANSPRMFNERFATRAVIQIHSAQATYAATHGNGHYALTLEELRQVDLIDSVLASGSKYGYTFAMSVAPVLPGAADGYFVTATPQRYPKTGRRSFFIDASGELHGDDKSGADATAADPYIDSCALWGIADNERCTIQDLRTLHGAEITYQATSGIGNFGTLVQLGETSIINRFLATGLSHRYRFAVALVDQTPNVPASFKITAIPQDYGTTGIRSFFVDTSGVMRGADKNGGPADENDPPVYQ